MFESYSKFFSNDRVNRIINVFKGNDWTEVVVQKSSSFSSSSSSSLSLSSSISSTKPTTIQKRISKNQSETINYLLANEYRNIKCYFESKSSIPSSISNLQGQETEYSEHSDQFCSHKHPFGGDDNDDENGRLSSGSSNKKSISSSVSASSALLSMPSNRFVSFEAKFKMVGSEHDPNRIISDSHHQNDHNQFNLQREKFANKERERRETISLRFERKNTKIFENSLIPLLLLVFHLLSASTSSCLMVYATEQEDIAKYPIHKQMTKQDLLSVFYVDSHDKVPEYELSSVRFLSKRSISKNQYSGDGDEVDDQSSSNTKHVQLKAFGKKMSLKLQDNNDFNERVKDMKVFIAESSRNGKLKYMEDLSASDTKNFGTSYHDVDNMAAIMLDRNSKGKMQLHGTIGNDLVIKPIPETVGPIDHPSLNEIDDGSEGPGPDDDEMFLNEDDFAQMRDYNQTTTTLSDAKMKNHTTSKYPILKRRQSPLLDQNLHVIFKRNVHQISPHHSIDFAELEHGLLGSADIEALRAKQWLGDLNATLSRSRSPRRKRQAPGTVWPEVLLVVDYDSFMLHGATSRDVKRYFISFWNGVDLRYKLLVHPQIRVSLAGMIVAKDRDATPYLERNRLRPPNADAVDAAGALTDMGKYLYREDRLPTYDMAVVITKLDMCRRRYEGGRCNRGTAGFAYVGGACVVNKRLEKVNSVAIIEDSGGYSGIIVAAHEVGHLLGCVHDGSPPPSYLGGPGATHCPWEDGFIMSDLRHTERGFRWSSCSVEQFKHFLNGETATCLYNFPHENQLLPRVLPGSMLSLDEQCKRDRGTNACFKDGRVCAQLFCFDSASGYCVSYRPAAEGSPCGDGQICRNGKCLAEMENIIPDYSHVQQAISRGPKSDRILSRIDHGPMHHHLPPYRRSLRFRGRESFFNNYLRGAASEQQPNVLSMI